MVFYRNHEQVLHILHEIMPNGYLRITQKGLTPQLQPYTNIELYHKQLSVLPYSASVAGAMIKPTEDGGVNSWSTRHCLPTFERCRLILPH